MTPQAYLSFLTIAIVLAMVPGPDFAIVTRNTLAGGRARGWATAAGIALACAVQGLLAAAGLGAVIVASEPLFLAIKWAGVLYLAWLAIQALVAAWRGEYADLPTGTAASRGFRQGVLSNITNPKVLVFYLAVLPQFLGDGGFATLLLLALTHAVVGLLYLGLLVLVMDRAGAWLRRARVRRTIDAATGVALGAFSVRLALEHS